MKVALVDPGPAATGSVEGLVRAGGYDVVAFTDANAALAAIGSDPDIGVVVAGSEAEPISGIEFCWEARLLGGRRRPIYILLMAPHEQQRTRCEALDGGADDVIDRPPPPEELYAKLRVAQRVIALQKDLMESATIDPLTGIFNRGAFFEAGSEACREATPRCPLTAVLIDVDHFKAINDRYGHAVGDAALHAVAGALQWEGAIVGRLGGDEFGVLLLGGDIAEAIEEAIEIAEGLRRRIVELRLSTAEGAIGLTCSLGVGQLQPEDTIDDLMKQADLALYRAKEEGRNRVALPPSGGLLSQRPQQAVSLVRSLSRASPASTQSERRKGLPPSDALLARICAVLDLLIASGMSEEGAAQVMVRRMLAAGVSSPRAGSERTGWKRLLAWRGTLLEGLAGEAAIKEYREMQTKIESIRPQERVERALADEIWNRRRRSRSQLGSSQNPVPMCASEKATG